MELRAYFPGGIKAWDVESVEHGWKVWASFTRADAFFRKNVVRVCVVVKGSPL